MASNTFGNVFKMITWGESHGKALGVVIDGCPAGIELSEADIYNELVRRSPGNSPYTSPRKESDVPHIFSGIFEGKTTGAPLSIIIFNEDADSSRYDSVKNLYKPGHAHFTYEKKYGIFDYRGGGRASGRETVCRVAAGAVAKKILAAYGMCPQAYLSDPDMLSKIEEVKRQGDSIGGVVEVVVPFMQVGLGDPVYEKLEANLALAMLSIPAAKGFEIGAGFASAQMTGSAHNDIFDLDSSGQVVTKTNYAGGTLGGISTGMPLVFRVAFKPTSSIKKPQSTLSTDGEKTLFELPEGSRHDPCVAVRAVPVVEAMTAVVLVDALLMNRLMGKGIGR